MARRWVSGLAAPVVAALLWRRHPRARFAAYVFFSIVALRGLAAGAWAAARRAWPRLRPGRTRAEYFC